MKKSFMLGVLTAMGLFMLPEQSQAQGLGGNHPYYNHGMGWLKSMAFNQGQWIHQTPLFSYGPYGGPGYVDMRIPRQHPHWGIYTPADASLYNGGYNGYPAQGPNGQLLAPTSPTPVGQGIPGIAPAAPAASTSKPGLFRGRIIQAAFYPDWLTGGK